MLFTLLHLLLTRMNINNKTHTLFNNVWYFQLLKFITFCSIFQFITDRKKMYTNQLTSGKRELNIHVGIQICVFV